MKISYKYNKKVVYDVVLCEPKKVYDTINLKNYGYKEDFYIEYKSFRKAILEYFKNDKKTLKKYFSYLTK